MAPCGVAFGVPSGSDGVEIHSVNSLSQRIVDWQCTETIVGEADWRSDCLADGFFRGVPSGTARTTGKDRSGGTTAPPKQQAARQDVTALLELQRDSWNQGDLQASLIPYWNSDQLTFCSGGETQQGFVGRQARCRKSNPNREAMRVPEFT